MVPTVIRAACVTAGQLASYDHTKFYIKEHNLLEDGVPLHIMASLVSGFCATTVAAPADVIKTRIMADRSSGGRPLYNGTLDCLVQTVRHEGPQALMKGWLPSYLRLGPHFIVSLPLYEQFRRLLGLNYM